MSDARASDGKYHVEIRDARGVVIGDNNVVYQYFLDERYRPLAEHLITFADLIAERTADFVGRAFLDARLAAFMEQHDRGYFVLVGEPGIGKTAWAAHIVREHQALHHFNVSAMGIVRPDQCLENLCAQIIARFQLDQPFLPVSTGRDGSLLDKLLRQAAGKLDGRKLVIAIDALDEAQMPADIRGANALYLPISLPAGVYFVLTRRPQPMPLETAPGTPSEAFTLGAELPDNQADVYAYLRQQAGRPEFVARLTEQRIPTERFVEELAERSAGNFMYLAYLLPDIAAGLFDPPHLTGLPQGLRGYYERFWNELESAKGEGREAWTKFYKPVIGILAATREPVSAAWIGRILGLDPDEVADLALARWRKFLYWMDVAGEVQWRLYHFSLTDFLTEKLNGAKLYHKQIADYYRELCNSNWLKLIESNGTYALRHMAAHLANAERWEDLHELVAEGKGNHQEWAEARHKIDGSYLGYLEDLRLAWTNARRLTPPKTLETGRQIRYALIESSIRTLAAAMPVELLVALAKYQPYGWSQHHVLDYVQQLSDPRQQARILAELMPHLNTECQIRVINTIEQYDETLMIESLLSLARYLPPSLHTRILSRVSKIEDEMTVARVITELVPLLPSDFCMRALKIAGALQNPRIRAMALGALATGLKANQKQTIQTELKTLVPLLNLTPLHMSDIEVIILAPYLPQKILDDFFSHRGDFRNWSHDLKSHLADVYPFITAEASSKLLHSILDSLSHADQDRFSCEMTMLAPLLSRELISKALSIALDNTAILKNGITPLIQYLDDEQVAYALRRCNEMVETSPKALALSRLIPALPERTQRDVATQSLQTVASLSLGDMDYAAEIVARLAPYLSSMAIIDAFQFVTDRLGHMHSQDQVRCLLALAPRLPKQLHSKALKVVVKRTHPAVHSHVLGNLASRLSQPHKESALEEALAAIHLIKDESERGQEIVHLAKALPAKLLEDLVILTERIASDRIRVRTLCELLSELPIPLRDQALDNALRSSERIQDEENRSAALVRMVPHLSFNQINELLWLLPQIQNEFKRAVAFYDFGRSLTSDLSDQSLPFAMSFKSLDCRTIALSAIHTSLPPDLRLRVRKLILRSVQTLCSGNKSHSITRTVPYLPADVLVDAMFFTARIKHPLARARVFAKIASHLSPQLLVAGFDKARNFKISTSTLHEMLKGEPTTVDYV